MAVPFRIGSWLAAAAILAAAALYAVPRWRVDDPEIVSLVFQSEEDYLDLWSQSKRHKGAYEKGSTKWCTRGLPQYFEERDGRWYLPGQDVQWYWYGHEGEDCRLSHRGLGVVLKKAPAAWPRRVASQAAALAVALVLCSIEDVPAAATYVALADARDPEEALRASVRRGARIAAAKVVAPSKYILAFRLTQVFATVWTFVLLNTWILPWAAELLLAFLCLCPALVLSGWSVMTRPTWLLSPPGTAVSGLAPVGRSGTGSLVLSASRPLLAVAVSIVGLIPVLTTGYPPAGGVWNIHVLRSWQMQGELAARFATIMFLAGVCLSALHSIWTAVLVYRGFAENKAAKQEALQLCEKIQRVAVARLRHAQACEGDGGLLSSSPSTAACDFPPEVKEEVAVIFPVRLGISSWRFGLAPGGMVMTLVLLVLDLLTDAYSVFKLLASGHYKFAFLIGTCIYASTIIQARRGLWQRLRRALRESICAGVPTEDFLDIRDTERGLETLPNFVVQAYALPYIGLRTIPEVCAALLSILLSLHGLVQYIVETVDFEFDEAEPKVAADPVAASAAGPDADTAAAGAPSLE